MIVRVFFFSFLSLGQLEVLSHDGIVPLVQSLDGEWNLWNSNILCFLKKNFFKICSQDKTSAKPRPFVVCC